MLTKKQEQEIENLSPFERKKLNAKIKSGEVNNKNMDLKISRADLAVHNHLLQEKGRDAIEVGHISEHVLEVCEKIMENKAFLVVATPKQVLKRVNKYLEPFERMSVSLFEKYMDNPHRVVAESFESAKVLSAFIEMLETYQLEIDVDIVKNWMLSTDWKASQALMKVRNPDKFDVADRLVVTDKSKQDKQETARAEALIAKYEVIEGE